MSASPSTTAIALAPAEPRRTASAPSALATTTAEYGLRDPRRDQPRPLAVESAAAPAPGRWRRPASRTGRLTAPAVSAPRSHRATWTAQSWRPCSPNSLVPSSGSTIHTRSAWNRRGVLDALLGQDDVVRPGAVQLLHEEAVAGHVAGVHDLPRVGALGGRAWRAPRPAPGRPRPPDLMASAASVSVGVVHRHPVWPAVSAGPTARRRRNRRRRRRRSPTAWVVRRIDRLGPLAEHDDRPALVAGDPLQLGVGVDRDRMADGARASAGRWPSRCRRSTGRGRSPPTGPARRSPRPCRGP